MLLFISDLHLAPQRPDITQAFYQFLDTTAQAADALYILGDLFEVWLGDDEDAPVYQEITRRIHTYSQQRPVYFICGNRDFLVGKVFAQQAGITLLPDIYSLEYQHHHYLLMHGDSLCTKDHDYMVFRQQTRSADWQEEFLTLPLEERRKYANQVRQKSKTMNSLKPEDIMDVTQEEVIRVMAKHQSKSLIHGHTHRPDRHPLTINHQQVERVVLGDWGHKGWYAQLDNKGLELHSFNI